MSLTTALLTSVVVFALTSLVAVPGTRAALKRSPSVKAAGWLGLWSFLRTYSLLASLTLGAILAALKVVEARGGATIDEVNATLGAVQWAKGWAAKLSGGWAALSAASIAVAFSLISYFRAKARIGDFLDNVANREFERIKQEITNGTLEELPPTPQMQESIRVVVELDAMLKKLDGKLDEQSKYRREQLLRAIEEAQTHYMRQLVQQHMNISLKAEDVPLPERPDGWRHRLAWFFMSDGLQLGLAKGGRLLYAGAFALLVASFVGFGAGKADATLGEKQAEVQKLVASLDFLQNELEPWLEEQVQRAEVADEGALAEEAAELREELAAANELLDEEDDDDGPSDLEPIRAKLDSAHAAVRQTQSRIESARTAQESIRGRVSTPRSSPEPASTADTAKARQDFSRTPVPDPVSENAKNDLGAAQADLEKAKSRSTPIDRVEQRVADVEQRISDSLNREAEGLREMRAKAERRLSDVPIERERIDRALSGIDAAESRSLGPLDSVKQEAESVRTRLNPAREGRGRLLAELDASAADIAKQIERANADVAELGNARQALLADIEHAEAASEWKSAKAGAPPAADLSAADRRVLHEIAQQFELASLDSDYSEPVRKRPSRSGSRVRSAVARDSILKRAAERAPSPREHIKLDALDSASFEVYKQAATEQDVLRTELGRNVYAELEDAAKRDPRLLEKLRSQGEAGKRQGGFQRPTPTRTARLAILEHLTGVRGDQPAFTRAVDTRMYRALNAIHGGAPVNEAVRLVIEDPPNRPSFTPDGLEQTRTWLRDDLASFDRLPLEDSLERRQPALRTPEPPNTTRQAVDLVTERARARLASASMQNQSPMVQLDLLDVATEPLARYEDTFPARDVADSADLEAAERSARERAQRNAARASTVANRSYSQRYIGRSKSATTRARSFTRLRGFRRIGGVLIGYDPVDAAEQQRLAKGAGKKVDLSDLAAVLSKRDVPGGGDDPGVDLVDLQWDLDDTHVRFTVTDYKGTESTSDRYPRVLAELALAYAADGRPTTVTMVKNSSLPDWRIMLHPALVDTPLGYEAIELDRFVDRFTSDSDWRREWEQRVQRQRALYDYAHLLRLSLFQRLGVFRGQLVPLGEQISAALKRVDRDELLPLIQNPGQLNDPEQCPLTKKTEFFDPSLVDAIVAASKTGQTWEGFDQALTESAEAEYSKIWVKHRPSLTFGGLSGFNFTPSRNLGSRFNRGDMDTDEILERTRERAGLQNPMLRPDLTNLRDTTTSTAGYDDALRWSAQHKDWVSEYNAKVGEYNRTTMSFQRDQLEQEMKSLKAAGERFDKVADELLRRWLEPTAEFVVWSGVRERKFELDLDNVLPSKVSITEPPLEFMLQIAFTTPPAFLGDSHIHEKSSEADKEWAENYDDLSPWQFPGIAAQIEESVLSAVNDDDRVGAAGDQRTLADMYAFTSLQRFFRMAFEGRLGDDFPANKLDLLHADIGREGYPPLRRTLRWHSRAGGAQSSTLFALMKLRFQTVGNDDEEGAERAAEPGAEEFDRYIELLREFDTLTTEHAERRVELASSRGDEAARSEQWSSDWDAAWSSFDKAVTAWEKKWQIAASKLDSATPAGGSGDGEEQTPSQLLAKAIGDLTYQIELRRALGIAEDDRQAIEEQIGLVTIPRDWPIPANSR